MAEGRTAQGTPASPALPDVEQQRRHGVRHRPQQLQHRGRVQHRGGRGRAGTSAGTTRHCEGDGDRCPLSRKQTPSWQGDR